MASFMAHGLVGGALTNFLTVYFGLARRKVSWLAYWVSFGIGFFLGSMNDTIDRVYSWVSGGPQYGDIYHWFHHYMPMWFAIVFFPSGIHYWMDKPFHVTPGENWWPRMWHGEVAMWLVPLAMLSLTFMILWKIMHDNKEGGMVYDNR